jgi:hypothetical protein
LQAVVHDVAGGRDPEDAVSNIKSWTTTVAGERELALLVELVRYALSCCNRLTHIPNEVGAMSAPPPSLDELRRAVFLTTVVCNEIDAPRNINKP